jgi:hypothetical protein
MGILDTQNLNDGLLANFDDLDNKRAPFGKRGQYNVGEDTGSNQYFGGFTYASDDTTREAFGTDAKSTRQGPIGNPLDQGNDFKYGTEGQARLSTSQSTVLTQAAKMTAGEDTKFGSKGSAAQIALSWTSSDELRSLRNTQTGSGQETSGYDANNSYGISNWNTDLRQATMDAKKATQERGVAGYREVMKAVEEGEYAGVNQGGAEVYKPQVTVATGLRNIDGIRDGVSMGHGGGPGNLAAGA